MIAPKYPPNTKLKALREKRGLSHEAVAYHVRERGFTVAAWESGHQRMSIKQARKVAFVLGANLVSDILMADT